MDALKAAMTNAHQALPVDKCAQVCKNKQARFYSTNPFATF